MSESVTVIRLRIFSGGRSMQSGRLNKPFPVREPAASHGRVD